MGMFDYVNFKADCFLCGSRIADNWQTKDSEEGDCTLSVVDLWQVEGLVYNICPKCEAWNEYEVRGGTPVLKPQEELPEYQRVSEKERVKAEEIRTNPTSS